MASKTSHHILLNYEFGGCIWAYSAQLSRIERLTMTVGGLRSGSVYTFDCCFWECVFAG